MGFRTVDLVAARASVSFRKVRFWNAERARLRLGGEEITLLKPLSYVNLSGPVVRKAAADLEVETGDLLVVLDDFWLPLGRLRIRRKGGDGGHHGLASILSSLATEEVARLRIGIGSPRGGEAVKHVLSRFRADESGTVEKAIEDAAEAVKVWALEGVEAAMNRYNPPSGESPGRDEREPEVR